MKTFLVVYCGSFLVSILTTPVVILLARQMGLVDAPGLRKVHASVIPRIGGVAIFFAMMALIVPVFFLHNEIGQRFSQQQLKITMLLVASVFMFLVGFIDDLRGMRAKTKLLGELIAAVAIAASGSLIDSIELGDSVTIELGWFAWPITVLWIVGITNAVNLIDGLDGLAAGISTIACTVIAVFALYTGQVMMATFMLALLGSLCGFLFFNFNPARIFMGDCGSLFLGFVLAASSVVCANKSTTVIGLAMPAIALGLPIFDTLFSMLRRFLERRSMFSPDRGHIHHRLLDMGLHHKHVVLVLYGVTIIAAGLSLFMMVTRDAGTVIVFGCLILLIMLFFRLAGSVRLRETFSGLHRNLAIARRNKEQMSRYEKNVLRLRESKTFDAWWQAICTAAEELDFAWLAMKVITRDGITNTLIWRSNDTIAAADLAKQKSKLITLTLPIHDRRSEAPLELQAAVKASDSLESAGRRATLFSRLVDEYNLRTLPEEKREVQKSRSLEDEKGEKKETGKSGRRVNEKNIVKG